MLTNSDLASVVGLLSNEAERLRRRPSTPQSPERASAFERAAAILAAHVVGPPEPPPCGICGERFSRCPRCD